MDRMDRMSQEGANEVLTEHWEHGAGQMRGICLMNCIASRMFVLPSTRPFVIHLFGLVRRSVHRGTAEQRRSVFEQSCDCPGVVTGS